MLDVLPEGTRTCRTNSRLREHDDRSTGEADTHQRDLYALGDITKHSFSELHAFQGVHLRKGTKNKGYKVNVFGTFSALDAHEYFD